MNKELYQLLRDEATLLTSLELRFLEEVKNVVDCNLHSADKYYSSDDDEQVLDLRRKITVLEENAILILKCLKKGRSAREKFVRTYPEFEKNRKKCISKLRKIAKSIKSLRFKCNVSKLVGYSTSTVGGGIALASAVLTPFTLGLTTPVAIGGALTAAGASTAVATSITEVALLKSKVGKAKKLIEKDKQYFESMKDWLEHASDLQEALANVLDIDIIKDITEQVANFVQETKTIKEQSEMKEAIEREIKYITGKFLPQFKSYLKDILEVINILAILVAVFLVLHNSKNRLIFDCASFTIKSILGIASGSFNVLNLTKALTANAAAARNLSKAIVRGAVAVVGIALDVLGIVLTSKDIREGSLCPEAEKIAEAACRLREEADILDRIYISILI